MDFLAEGSLAPPSWWVFGSDLVFSEGRLLDFTVFCGSIESRRWLGAVVCMYYTAMSLRVGDSARVLVFGAGCASRGLDGDYRISLIIKKRRENFLVFLVVVGIKFSDYCLQKMVTI